MPSLLLTLALLTLLTLTLAAPSTHPARSLQKRIFKIPRVPNPQFQHRSPGAGTRALIKAYRKYRMDLPPGLLDAMNAAGNGPHPANGFTNTATVLNDTANSKSSFPSSGNTNNTALGLVTATPEAQDVEYLSPVTIGGQTMNMNFDSGSADLWLFSTQLPAAAQANRQIAVYDPLKSASFQLMRGAVYTVRYGDGSGSAGIVGTDTVDIGGASVTSQAIELATAVSQSFIQDTASNGLVGLSFSSLNAVKPQQQKTFFDNVMPSLREPVFTADLRKQAVGSYEFGRIDPAKFDGTMQWTAVNTTTGFWQFSSENFIVGDPAAGAAIQKSAVGAQAIADTGTTLMLVAPGLVNEYYSQVQGAVNNLTVGGVTVPCSAQLPDLMVDVGTGFMAKVRGSDINFAPVDQSGQDCFGGVQAIPQNPQIYGDIFFKSNFVAFNGGNNSLGVAPHQ